ncbi:MULTISPECIES: DUF2339 domain-containing protein [Sorangium]|uniref:DUF2339 domain-containing protein n=1 Tax=Sorangium cellulosum TaxID=56 RepID=A0A4P2QN62_SORCE|nr:MULTISPECIES: DUF2339 domain-containing protein [Sorangium]AUX31465.1 hypothetical protein SOCE836_035940 [Sorangium cellulosum]WCQ90844.1 hypothetical protein NQZ70_03556 [Sorangium sp. Soce836]
MGAGIVVFFGLALAGYLLVAPLVAFVFAVRANRRNEDLLLRIHALEHRLAELSGQRGRPEPTAAVESPRSAQPLEPERTAQDALTPPSIAPPAAAGGAGALPAIDEGSAGAPAGIAFPDAATNAAGAPAGIAFPDDAAGAPPAIALPETVAPLQPRPAATLDESAAGAASAARHGGPETPTIEERLGLTWLTRAGAATFLLGALFFFKYASDNAWIGPLGRVAIGAVTGAALLAAAEVLRGRTQRRFVHALIGLGLAVLIVSVWASAALYELIPIPAAFAADTVLLLLGAALALRHRGEAILILSLVAGFLNPVVLSTGQDRPLVLFSYLLLMTSVVHAVAAKLGFRVAPWLALAGHTALFWGWYDRHFDASVPPDGGDPSALPWLDTPAQALPGPYLPLAARAVPLAFVGLAALQGVLRALWSRRANAAAGVAPAPTAVSGAASAPGAAPDVAPAPTAGSGAAPARTAASGPAATVPAPADGAPGAAPPDAAALAAASLALAHAGAGALLFDAPRALAAAAIALAVAATVALRALGENGWLLAPMGSAFLAFAATFADAPTPHRTAVAALVALWALVYLAGWLRGAGASGRLDRRTAVACSAGAALFACTAGMLLLETDAALFAVAIAGAAAVAAWMAARAELPALLLVAAVASAGAIAAAAPGALAPDDAAAPAVVDAGFLGASSLVMLVFLGAVGASARRPREPGATALPWSGALAASVATLGFVAAALGATPEETPTLRALLTAAAGALDLALGAALLRAAAPPAAVAPPAADRIALLLGQALALFAAAVAFGLGGATVTVVWGILAAVAAAIAARTGERAWLVVTSLLFLAALARALGVDRVETEALVTTWFDTRGRDGAMAAPVLLNARAYAFAGVSAALLAAGRLLSRAGIARAEAAERATSAARPARAGLRAAGLAALGAGYALLLATVVIEVRSALTALPPAPPAPLDAAEFAELAVQHRAALEGQQGSLAMATTLVLALAAIALLTAGFAARDAFHRYAGLSLFAVTIAKLVAWDVWHVERIYQIALFTGVGALLVGGGFLYARFGRRLVTLLRAGPKSAAGLCALLAATGLARPSEAQTGAPLRIEKHALVRPIDGVDAAGDHRIDVDLDLYRESRAEDLLADVRIAGPDGAEVPYVLRETGAAPSSGRIAATMLDPGVDAAGVAHATWALDAPGTRHCRVELSVLGSSFLREARVDTGADPGSLSEVARGAYVYRIPQDAEAVEHLAVAYPLSRAALVRIRLVPEGAPAPGGAADVRITGGTVACEPPAAAEKAALLPLAIVETRRDDDAQATLVTLDAGAHGAPLHAVLLDVATPEFSRRVDVASTTYRAVWPAVGSGRIHRIHPRGEAGPALASTRIPLSPTRKRFLRLTIHDGDSTLLSLSGAQGEVRAREIVFRAAQPGPHRLYVGDALGKRPRYDLGDVLDRVERERPPVAARLGAAQANPGFGAAPIARDLPFTERHRAPIGAALALGLLALSAWAARLLRRGAEPPDGGSAPSRQGTADREPRP